MITQQETLDSQKQGIRFTLGKGRHMLSAVLIAVCCAGAALAQAPQYNVSNLDTLGGTNSRGNSINDRSWVAGFSNLSGNQSRHAALWRSGSILDLGTLGGPNSNVTWSVKDNRGIIAGIAQTSTPDPLGEYWSCSAFFPGPNNIGYTCLGFVWENGQKRFPHWVETTALPRAPTTAVRWSAGRKILVMTQRAPRHRSSSFARSSGGPDKIRLRNSP